MRSFLIGAILFASLTLTACSGNSSLPKGQSPPIHLAAGEVGTIPLHAMPGLREAKKNISRSSDLVRPAGSGPLPDFVRQCTPGFDCPPYVDPCPDCVWNPIITSSSPSDLGGVDSAVNSCPFFGLSYDAYFLACFDPVGAFGYKYASLVYGPCSGGVYSYTGSAYLLTCLAPIVPNPKGPDWFWNAYFFASNGGRLIGSGRPRLPGEELVIEAEGPPSVFTNLQVCFKELPDQLGCTFRGGGLSVGI